MKQRWSRGILAAVAVLSSHVDVASPEFRENRAHMDGLVADLRERLAAARAGAASRR